MEIFFIVGAVGRQGGVARARLLARGFLLGEHLVKDGHDPVFEFAIVVVGDKEVADAIDALVAEGCSATVVSLTSLTEVDESSGLVSAIGDRALPTATAVASGVPLRRTKSVARKEAPR